MLKVKLTTVGNSTGIVFPKEVMGKLNVQKGDSIYFLETPDGYEITPYDQKFIDQMELAQSIMKEDRNILKVLAK